MLAEHSDLERSEQRALEVERFAIDHREVTMAMMADWGLPDAFVAAVEKGDEPDADLLQDGSRSVELTRTLFLANVLADFCTADSKKQVALWPSMEAVRAELEHTPEQFEAFCSELEEAWGEWGQMLQVRTGALPSVRHIERLSEKARIWKAGLVGNRQAARSSSGCWPTWPKRRS